MIWLQVNAFEKKNILTRSARHFTFFWQTGLASSQSQNQTIPKRSIFFPFLNSASSLHSTVHFFFCFQAVWEKRDCLVENVLQSLWFILLYWRPVCSVFSHFWYCIFTVKPELSFIIGTLESLKGNQRHIGHEICPSYCVGRIQAAVLVHKRKN